jgi:hypothetical protein
VSWGIPFFKIFSSLVSGIDGGEMPQKCRQPMNWATVGFRLWIADSH